MSTEQFLPFLRYIVQIPIWRLPLSIYRIPIFAVALLNCAGLVHSEEVIKTYTVSGHARVRIQTDDGAVRVSTGDIKQIEIRIDYEGYKLDRDLHITSSQNGDLVDLTAKTSSSWGIHWGGGHQNLRVEVHMP